MHKKNRRASARSRYMVAARVLQSVVAIAMIRNGLLGQIWRFYSSQKTGSNVKTAIVMMNMGGPQHVSEVYEYLLKIMTDRNMIQFPFFQDLIGKAIAKRRTQAVTEKYMEIGGKSPILDWTKKQGQLLCQKLNNSCRNFGPFKSYVAFRYVNPLTEDCFKEIEKDGVKRIILFSQYPQYSCATSGSSFHAIYEHLKNHPITDLQLKIIDRWGTHPLLIKVFVELIKQELNKFSTEQKNNLMILFSAHSLPLKTVCRGDSYPSEIGATVNLVMREFNHAIPYQLVWQSKVGPLPWLGPFTDEAMTAYVKRGIKNFILVPIAFVNEHIETLHEMDIEYCKDLASKIKIERISRVPAPNDHPIFIDSLEDIVKQCLTQDCNISRKFLSNCPHCINPNCYEHKLFFSNFI